MPSAAETAGLGSSQKNEAGLRNRRLTMYQQPHTINFMLATLLTLVVLTPRYFIQECLNDCLVQVK